MCVYGNYVSSCDDRKRLPGIFNVIIMRHYSKACYFTDFSCGLLGFDIEWQAFNSYAQSTKGNRAILLTSFRSIKFNQLKLYSVLALNFPVHTQYSVLSTPLAAVNFEPELSPPPPPPICTIIWKYKTYRVP